MLGVYFNIFLIDLIEVFILVKVLLFYRVLLVLNYMYRLIYYCLLVDEFLRCFYSVIMGIWIYMFWLNDLLGGNKLCF